MSLTECAVFVAAITACACVEWYCKEFARKWRALRETQGR